MDAPEIKVTRTRERERAVAWCRANPEKVKAYKDKYRASHKEQEALYSRSRPRYKPSEQQIIRRRDRLRLKYKNDPVFREKHLAACRKWAEINSVKNKAYHRREWLQRGYGLTVEEHDLLIEKQNGACAICGTTEKRLRIDHNHTTGKVRGLLCQCCNSGIGMFFETPDLLQKAISYIESFSSNP